MKKEYFMCPFCSHNYLGRVPKGGDGSMLFFPKHNRIIPHSNNLGATILPGRKEICPGSWRSVENAKDGDE
jgi:hypothetical protein